MRAGVLVLAFWGCGQTAKAPVTSNEAEVGRETPITPPSLDQLIALLEPQGAVSFSAAAQGQGCPGDKTVGEYVETLVRIGREGEDPTDVHSLTGGCGDWPSETIPIDPPRDNDFYYCKLDSKTSDPAGESPWNYDLRIRVSRRDLTPDLATAGCGGAP